VNPAVKRDAEISVTSRRHLGHHPEDDGGRDMVVDVEEADLLQVALEEHNVGIEELPKFGQIEDIHDPSNALITNRIIGHTPEAIAVGKDVVDHGDTHPERETGEEEVVDLHKCAEHRSIRLLLRREHLLVAIADKHNKQVLGEEQETRGRGSDKRPVLGNRSSKAKIPTKLIITAINPLGYDSVDLTIVFHNGVHGPVLKNEDS
jgi:hypothetical protein